MDAAATGLRCMRFIQPTPLPPRNKLNQPLAGVFIAQAAILLIANTKKPAAFP
jgi:hypothetical protein